MTVNGIYNFTLSIFDNNVVVATCNARVEVVPTKEQAFTLSYLDNSNSRGYIDPSST
jgi:hypothetical protein